MIDNYKVVCNTAAGRRRYMQYLVPQVVASDVVDRYDIWINTTDKQDIEFFRLLAEEFPKINLVYQPDGVVNGISSINAFYRECVEEDTIYFKLDDDIIWIEPGMFEKMVRFRIDHPEYFLVSPLVINNALSTYILSLEKKIELIRYCPARSSDPLLWGNGEFAAQLHEWFLNDYLKTGKYDRLYCGVKPVAMNRFSINAVLWFGREMKKFGGIVPGDDEEWLSCIKPAELGMANCFNCDAIVSHFAFYSQRETLDKRTILEQYGVYLRQQWKNDPAMAAIMQTVFAAMQRVEEQKEIILSQASIYPPPPVKFTKSRLGRICVPVVGLRSLGEIKQACADKKKVRYIIK